MLRHVGFVLVLLLGCGDDDGPSGTVDAAVGGGDARVDADPSCGQWARVSVPLVEVVSMESMPINPERSARVLVDVQHCPGDLPAMPEYGFTLENEYVALRMSVWRSGPDCAPSDRVTVQRPVVIRFLYPGGWKFILEGGAVRTVSVVAAPGGACNPNGGDCARDCECTTGVCLSGYGFAGPYSACTQPCELDRDCLGTGSCATQVADGISYACFGGTECDASRPCPQGFSCSTGACQPDFVLSASTRHQCMCDAQCENGLRCTYFEGAATGTCEALCQTASDGWCQGPHVCAGSVEPGYGQCGWIGE